MSKAVIEIKEGAADLKALARLRFDVWRETGDLASTSYRETDWVDEHDHHATHWLAWNRRELVAAIRVCLHQELAEIPDSRIYPKERGIRKTTDLPAACLNRLVIHTRIQRTGLGGRMIKLGIDWAKIMGARTVIVSTNSRLSSLLVKAGFIPIGTPTFDPMKPALPLQFMLLRLRPPVAPDSRSS